MSTSSRQPPHSRLVAWLTTLAACVLALACSGGNGATTLPGSGGSSSGAGTGSGEQAPARVVATILLQNDQLTLLDLRPASDDALPPHPAHDPKLVWALEADDGEIVASGELTAPTLAVSEFDETGKASPAQATAPTALFEVEIPNVGGTFTLSDGSASGTQGQSWGGFFKKLTLFIQKLVGKFTWKGSSGSGGTSAGSGGATGTGSATGSGGASAGGSTGTGSAAGSGGASGTGSAAGSGGSSAGSGGAAGTGSTTGSGGASAGGTTGSGSSAGSGATGGNNGSAAQQSAQETEVGPNVQMGKPESACTAFTLLLVAEGYTKAEESKFNADAAHIVEVMKARPVYAENWKYVAVWRKFFVSNESGISDPAANVHRDTAFRVEHDPAVHRVILMASDAPADSLAKLAQARGETKADVVLVIANTAEYAGVAIPDQRIGFASTHELSGQVMGHELAHALFGLADEYDYGTCNPSASYAGPNVAIGLDAIPWSPMLTKGVALPTTGADPSVVGAYEGAMYCSTGVYRPQHTCYMRELESGLCEVCKAHIQGMFNARTLACQPKGTCGHSECEQGDALNKDCGPCASSICTTNPECCDPEKGWTKACVEIAQNLQGVCRGVCADGQGSCSHDECSEGSQLPSSCSTCAQAVCKRDPFCCESKWDAICASEAEKDPYCSCGTSE